MQHATKQQQTVEQDQVTGTQAQTGHSEEQVNPTGTTGLNPAWAESDEWQKDDLGGWAVLGPQEPGIEGDEQTAPTMIDAEPPAELQGPSPFTTTGTMPIATPQVNPFEEYASRTCAVHFWCHTE